MIPEILIVNKSKEEQKAIKTLLSSFDMNLNFTENGSDALSFAKRKKPTLIVSQIHDTTMDGITMADIIRKDKVLRDMPIIFLHDKLELNLIAAAKQVRSKAFLIHPYVNNSLIYAVKRVLEMLPAERAPIKISKPAYRSYLYAG